MALACSPIVLSSLIRLLSSSASLIAVPDKCMFNFRSMATGNGGRNSKGMRKVARLKRSTNTLYRSLPRETGVLTTYHTQEIFGGGKILGN